MESALVASFELIHEFKTELDVAESGLESGNVNTVQLCCPTANYEGQR